MAGSASSSVGNGNGAGGEGVATPGAGGDSKEGGQTLWPAWVYCTRYSDRPSSGEPFSMTTTTTTKIFDSIQYLDRAIIIVLVYHQKFDVSLNHFLKILSLKKKRTI